MCSNKSRPSSIFPQVKIVRVIDFETYYDREYSLSKMTTEEYIRDPRFEVVGFAYQDYSPDGTPIDEEPKWVTGDHAHIWDYLNNALDWGDVAVVAHNTAFDGPILSWQFGVNPAQWCDTLSMSRPYYGLTAGGSLKALAEALGVGVKGTEVENALGKHRTDFTPEEMHRYAEYCKNDVSLTGKIFFMLADRLPAGEAYIIDMFMRMRTQPVLEVDVPMLEEWLEDYKASQKDIMKRALKVAAAKSAKVRNKLKEVIAAGDSPRKLFSSNPIFKEILEALGYPVPEKVSPTTGKKIPALGKKDPEFLKFVEERADDELLQTLVAARQQVKSTLLETRAQRFIDMGGRGPLPIPLKYYGAHTGRASGEDKLNFQNMPRGSIIRKAIKAPEGHTLVVVDSGQIEARGLAWVAGQQDVVQQFANGEDVYKIMASKVYGVPVEEVTKDQRQVGKLCIAEGMPVLTDSGWKPIEKVTLADKVWDGVEWVSHDGVVCKGEKDVIEYQGLVATSDHEVWTKESGLVPFGVAASKGETPASGADLWRMDCGRRDTRDKSGREAQQAPVLLQGKVFLRGGAFSPSGQSRGTPLYTVQQVRKTESRSNERVDTLQHSLGKAVGACVRSSKTAVPKPSRPALQTLRWAWGRISIRITAACCALGYGALRASTFAPALYRQNRQRWALRTGQFALGYANAAVSQPEAFEVAGGFCLSSRGMAVRRINRSRQATSRVYQRANTGTGQTSGAGETQRVAANKGATRRARVYDILNAGPRHRFYCAGWYVHNCVLALGYGQGATKFKDVVHAWTGIKLSEEEAKRAIDTYRSANHWVAKFWRTCDDALRIVSEGGMVQLGPTDACRLIFEPADGEEPARILLPNGMALRYPKLRWSPTDESYKYTVRRGRAYQDKYLWGGVITENIVQALARIVVFEQMTAVEKKLRKAQEKYGGVWQTVLTVHDEIVLCAPEKHAERVLDLAMTAMETAPSWAEGWPVAADGDIAKRYGEAK